MSEPKQHHTVPAGYLRGFGAISRRQLRVHVFDTSSGKWRQQVPEKVASQNRFYAVDLPGVDPNFVEKRILGPLDNRVPPLIRGLQARATRALDKGRRRLDWLDHADLDLLLKFVSMAWLRTRLLRARGERLAAALDLPLDRTFYLSKMVQVWEPFQRALREKTPSLLFAGGSAGLFVTSDAPVGVCRLAEAGGGSELLERHEVDIRHPTIGIVMPLGAELALHLNARVPAEVRQLSREEVAKINSLAATTAEIVIARTKDFCWWDGSQLRKPEDLPAFLPAIREVQLAAESERIRARLPGAVDQMFGPAND
jgi:hypothetical protein